MKGYDSLLGKWFYNGKELSVGERQRIALARAFVHKSPILLLDEATSAMDYWAEADWIERLRENARGRTILLITHRFTTAMEAITHRSPSLDARLSFVSENASNRSAQVCMKHSGIWLYAIHLRCLRKCEAVQELERPHPGIQIVGRANGYVSESEMRDLIERINALRTDILFVALGSPRQEEWLHRWLPVLNVRVCQGIGGTLDTIVGKVKRAPVSWPRLGLEWLYRLMHEPSGIVRQAKLVQFAWEIIFNR